MSLVSIGPITLGTYEHGNPSYSWGGSPAGSPAALGGLLTWAHAKQLRALVRHGRHQTIEGATGVLERIEFSGDLFAELSGLYVLQSANLDPSKSHTMDPEGCPFSLTAAYLGDQA